MPIKKPSREKPTQKEQLAELREQVAALIEAVQKTPEAGPEGQGQGQAGPSPLETIQAPVLPAQAPSGPGLPSAGRFIRLVLIAACCAASLAAGRWIEQRAQPVLPAHKAIVVYARLIASDVCGEIEAQIQRCEEAEDPFTAEQLQKILLERGEEARSAAWQPVLESLNDLQGTDGSIDYAKARKAIAETRKGLEAVR